MIYVLFSLYAKSVFVYLRFKIVLQMFEPWSLDVLLSFQTGEKQKLMNFREPNTYFKKMIWYQKSLHQKPHYTEVRKRCWIKHVYARPTVHVFETIM